MIIKMKKMDFTRSSKEKNGRFYKGFFYFVISLFLVTACWVGLEYVLEGVVHTSEVDGYVAIILSGFIANSCMNIRDKLKK